MKVTGVQNIHHIHIAPPACFSEAQTVKYHPLGIWGLGARQVLPMEKVSGQRFVGESTRVDRLKVFQLLVTTVLLAFYVESIISLC